MTLASPNNHTTTSAVDDGWHWLSESHLVDAATVTGLLMDRVLWRSFVGNLAMDFIHCSIRVSMDTRIRVTKAVTRSNFSPSIQSMGGILSILFLFVSFVFLFGHGFLHRYFTDRREIFKFGRRRCDISRDSKLWPWTWHQVDFLGAPYRKICVLLMLTHLFHRCLLLRRDTCDTNQVSFGQIQTQHALRQNEFDSFSILPGSVETLSLVTWGGKNKATFDCLFCL